MTNQWRALKIFMEGFHSVAYGGHWYLVCAVCDVTIDVTVMSPNQRFGDVY